MARGTPFYAARRVPVEQAAEIIVQAGGKAGAGASVAAEGRRVGRAGPRLGSRLLGVEAFHPDHSDGQCRMFESEARRLELFVTSGSDFHGALGSRAPLGGEKRGGAYLRKSIKALLRDIRSGA